MIVAFPEAASSMISTVASVMQFATACFLTSSAEPRTCKLMPVSVPHCQDRTPLQEEQMAFDFLLAGACHEAGL